PAGRVPVRGGRRGARRLVPAAHGPGPGGPGPVPGGGPALRRRPLRAAVRGQHPAAGARPGLRARGPADRRRARALGPAAGRGGGGDPGPLPAAAAGGRGGRPVALKAFVSWLRYVVSFRGFASRNEATKRRGAEFER